MLPVLNTSAPAAREPRLPRRPRTLSAPRNDDTRRRREKPVRRWLTLATGPRFSRIGESSRILIWSWTAILMPHKRPRLARIFRVRWRRWLRRLERVTPALLAWVPSWGTSLLLHGLAILVLALYLYVRSGGPREGTFHGTFANQLTEDLTSLSDSDHAGDPFTRLKSTEPPSLSVEAPDPSIDVISQPEIPQIIRFAPELAGPEAPPELGPSLGTIVDPGPSNGAKGAAKVASFRLHAEDLTAPFSGRGGPAKAKLLRREGGTVHSEKAVEDGLDWLVRHQRSDGGWSLNYHAQCLGTGCPEQLSLESDTAATGLALLPLLGAGHLHTQKSRYQPNIR